MVIQNPDSKQDTQVNGSRIEVVDNQDLENSKPHMKGFVHKNNKTYESPELMTIKQKNYLIKLIEIRYQDEPTRASLFNRLKSLTKSEARDAIGKMLSVA